MLELQPRFLHNREKSKANVRDRRERDSEQKSGNAEAFQYINQSNQRHKALKINSKFFFFVSLFHFSCPKKEKVNKEQTISKVLCNKLKHKVRGGYAPRKAAFTLAEVLITLGIIGVVAAMTLPTLIAKYQKQVVTTHLKKYYSVMSQAIKLAEAENGDIKYWPPQCSDDDSQCFRDWYNKYLDKHIKSIEKDDSDSLWYKVAFADGTGFMAYTTPTTLTNHYAHFIFCIKFKQCKKEVYDGQNSFLFSIDNNGKFIASLEEFQNSTRDELLESCSLGNRDHPDVSSAGKRHACARLIQIDGWEIKPDYPWIQTIITK